MVRAWAPSIFVTTLSPHLYIELEVGVYGSSLPPYTTDGSLKPDVFSRWTGNWNITFQRRIIAIFIRCENAQDTGQNRKLRLDCCWR